VPGGFGVGAGGPLVESTSAVNIAARIRSDAAGRTHGRAAICSAYLKRNSAVEGFGRAPDQIGSSP
jgi:hypothetical protein